MACAERSVESKTTEGFALESKRKTLRSEEHTSELQSQSNLVCRLLLEKKKKKLTRSHVSHSRKDYIRHHSLLFFICLHRVVRLNLHHLHHSFSLRRLFVYHRCLTTLCR